MEKSQTGRNVSVHQFDTMNEVGVAEKNLEIEMEASSSWQTPIAATNKSKNEEQCICMKLGFDETDCPGKLSAIGSFTTRRPEANYISESDETESDYEEEDDQDWSMSLAIANKESIVVASVHEVKKEPTSEKIEELVRREVQKIDKQIERKAEELKDKYRERIEQHVEGVIDMMGQQRL